MRKRIIALLLAIIGFILFLFIISEIGLSFIFDSLLRLNALFLIPYALAAYSIFFLLVIKWKIIIKALGYDVPLAKLFWYKCCGFAAAYLTPSAFIGGEGVRAYFLTRHGMTYTKGLASNVIDKQIELTINILFTAIGTILLILTLAIPRYTILAIILGLMLGFWLLGSFYYRIIREKPFFSLLVRPFNRFKFFKEMEENLENMEKIISSFLKRKKWAFLIALLISLLAWILMFLEYKLLLYAFGYNAPMRLLFLVIAAMGLAYIFPIPAALGVLEGGQASIFKFSNMKVSDGIALSIVIRLKDMIISFIGLFYVFNYGVSFKKKIK